MCATQLSRTLVRDSQALVPLRELGDGKEHEYTLPLSDEDGRPLKKGSLKLRLLYTPIN